MVNLMCGSMEIQMFLQFVDLIFPSDTVDIIIITEATFD